MRRHSAVRSEAFVVLALLGGALLDPNAVSAQQITLVSTASDGTPGDTNDFGDGSGAASSW